MDVAFPADPFSRSVLCFLLSWLVVVATDGYSLPPAARDIHRRKRTRLQWFLDELARMPIVIFIFAVFFAFSWRPLYAAAGTISFFVIFCGISRAKFQFIREPLLFSDLALVVDVFKHKEIFYASWLNVLFWIAAPTYVFGASTLFMIFEPTVLPATHRLVDIGEWIALVFLPCALLLARPYRQWVSLRVQAMFATDDIRTIVMRVGTFAAVAYHFQMWLGRQRPTAPARVAENPQAFEAGQGSAGVPEGSPLCVVWQSESFVDMRHFGVSSVELPHLDGLRRRAMEWGRLQSVFEGGYTLRTEFSVLSGLAPHQIGPDASYPYLRAKDYAEVAWPNWFRRHGWSTHFVHPYDRKFFARHKAMPHLGFETMTMLDAFDHDHKLDGRYVTDHKLADRVLDLCGNASTERKGQFIFAASMENHGPWLPGRFGDAQTALDIYLGILERSDRALGHLASELDGLDRPVWLLFYGDHVPILKSFADPFPDHRTDYLVVPLGRAATTFAAPPLEREKGPWNLIADLVSRVHGLQMPAAPVFDPSIIARQA